MEHYTPPTVLDQVSKLPVVGAVFSTTRGKFRHTVLGQLSPRPGKRVRVRVRERERVRARARVRVRVRVKSVPGGSGMVGD